MEHFADLMHGFAVALQGENFLYCWIGAVLGTLVGVLPGLGPIATIAILLPVTFKIPALASLIMLAGVYYGAHHAGSTTAIMLNMPGEPTSVVICFDGYPMARDGRAGPALCTSAISSFLAGCICVAIITLFSPPLAAAALKFGAAEYASLVVLALVATVAFSIGDFLKSSTMIILGLLLSTVGTDINSGAMRFTFGMNNVVDGVSFIAVAVGLFAVAELMLQTESPTPIRPAAKVRGLLPTRADLLASWAPILRGTGIGAIFGVMPGTGPLISSFASYTVEKSLARDPTRFGRGAIEGVAGPEAANNAAALTHFIPMLTLGIPAGAAMALMLGALMIHGISPGPRVMAENPDLFWGTVASMWIGNLMLLVLNLPLIGIWIRLLRMPRRFLYPAILVFCCIGVYSVINSYLDVLLAAGFGVLGYGLRGMGYSPSPLMLGLLLGRILEENLRRALLLSHGSVWIFIERPISCVLLVATAGLIAYMALPMLRRRIALPPH